MTEGPKERKRRLERERRAGWTPERKEEEKKRRRRLEIEWRNGDPIRVWALLTIIGIRKRCKATGMRCDIDVPYLIRIANKHCPVFGVELKYTVDGKGKGPSKHSPTVDKVLPNMGYVAGNVCVISWRANMLKCDGTPDELEAVAAYARKAVFLG